MDAPYDITTRRAEPVSFSGPSLLLSRVGTWLGERRKVSQITRELGRYSDRDLADMGLTRGDIPAVARGAMPRG